MKKGQIILSVAAAVVTLSSTVAFKVAEKFSGGNRVFVQTTAGKCVTCLSVRTVLNGSVIASCKTIHAAATISARNGKTYWKAVGAAKTCLTPVTKVVKAN